MPVISEDFSEPGLGVDTRRRRDDSGPPNNWRRRTPPAGEDGTIPSSSLLASDTVGHTLVTDEQVDVSFRNPIHPSTFDIPDSEWQ